MYVHAYFIRRIKHLPIVDTFCALKMSTKHYKQAKSELRRIQAIVSASVTNPYFLFSLNILTLKLFYSIGNCRFQSVRFLIIPRSKSMQKLDYIDYIILLFNYSE